MNNIIANIRIIFAVSISFFFVNQGLNAREKLILLTVSENGCGETCHIKSTKVNSANIDLEVKQNNVVLSVNESCGKELSVNINSFWTKIACQGITDRCSCSYNLIQKEMIAGSKSNIVKSLDERLLVVND